MNRFNVHSDDGRQMLLMPVTKAEAVEFCERYNRHANGDNPNKVVLPVSYHVAHHVFDQDDADMASHLNEMFPPDFVDFFMNKVGTVQ